MNKGRVGAIGCKTEEQHGHSGLMLINGVCCLWLSCQQITRCPKINHASCVGVQPRWLGFTLPRGIARPGAVFQQLALLGLAQRGRIWRSTKEKSLKKSFVLSPSIWKDSMFSMWLKKFLSQFSNIKLPGFSLCCQKVHVSCCGTGDGIWWKSWPWLFLSSWALFRVCSWVRRAAQCCSCDQKPQGAATCLWRSEGQSPVGASALKKLLELALWGTTGATSDTENQWDQPPKECHASRMDLSIHTWKELGH